MQSVYVCVVCLCLGRHRCNPSFSPNAQGGKRGGGRTKRARAPAQDVNWETLASEDGDSDASVE